MMQDATRYFLKRFERIESIRRLKDRKRRIGSELKFPLVNPDGRAADANKSDALWEFLIRKGWKPSFDNYVEKVTGAVKEGEMNEHRASCETGYCKVEFSLAHVSDLHCLNKSIRNIEDLVHEFSEDFGVAFLGFGLQPITHPGKHLLMNKSRNIFWDRIFGGNNFIAPENGSDVHLFTINASNQVHIDVCMDEAIDAINVLNGIAGPQIALTANSNIWKGSVQNKYKCLGEMFWDWWLKDKHKSRYGVPERKFSDLEDYFLYILNFSPVFVKRDKGPVGLPFCPTFLDFFTCNDKDIRCERRYRSDKKCAILANEKLTRISHEKQDLDQHFTFFWHNARLSRYYTLENRINDQQPPGEMLTIPALTLGIIENLRDAVSLINEYPWEVLREMRILASRSGLDARIEGIKVADLSRTILEIAEIGLKKRDLGEEIFLRPLKVRLENRYCPADLAADVFNKNGPHGFVERFKIKK